MRSALAHFVLLLLFCVVQSTLFPRIFRILGHVSGLTLFLGQTVDLLVITLVYFSLKRERNTALIWAVVYGVIAGWYGLAWHGGQAASYFLVVLPCVGLAKHIVLTQVTTIALLVGSMTLVEGLVHLTVGHLFGSFPNPVGRNFGVVIVQAVINALVAPLVFSALTTFDRWVGNDTQDRRRASLLDLEIR